MLTSNICLFVEMRVVAKVSIVLNAGIRKLNSSRVGYDLKRKEHPLSLPLHPGLFRQKRAKG